MSDNGEYLESALQTAEGSGTELLKRASALTATLRKYLQSAKTGTLSEMRKAIDDAAVKADGLTAAVEAQRRAWDFDEEKYLASPEFATELIAAAASQSVRIFRGDERLHCCPSLIRIHAADRYVTIDKAREKRLRPSVLAKRLGDLQQKKSRFAPQAFLESVFNAYGQLIRGRHPQQQVDAGVPVKLLDVYKLLTLLPGQSRDYPLPEFVRDVYLLDRSGTVRTKGGSTASFPASSGTRSTGDMLKTVTEEGREKIYYGIAFTAKR